MMPKVLSVEENDVTPITGVELLQNQAEHQFCKQAAGSAGQSASQYDQDRYRFLPWISAFVGMLQCVVQKRLRAAVLYLAYCP